MRPKWMLLIAAFTSFVLGLIGPVSPQQQNTWQLTGNEGERYQSYWVPAVFSQWATDLVERAGLQPGDRVLDIACGTGVVTRLAAQRVGRGGMVAGLDLDNDMLAVARALPPVSGPVIDWREGDALSLPFSSNAFQKVLCEQGLQFFPDRAKALREMHRVLASNGRVVISVWRSLSNNPYGAALTKAVGKHLNAEAAQEMSSPFTLGNAEELRLLLVSAGFRQVRIENAEIEMRINPVEEFIPGHLSTFPFFPALAAKIRQDHLLFIAELREMLKPYMRANELRVPWRALVGTGLK